MGLGATVGADLLAVPFPKMVLSLAQAIAKGQTALDKASLNTLKVLAKTKFDYIPEITEVLSPAPITAGGTTVTGVDVDLIAPRALRMTMLQAGICFCTSKAARLAMSRLPRCIATGSVPCLNSVAPK